MRKLISVSAGFLLLVVSNWALSADLSKGFKAVKAQWVAAGKPESGRWLEVGEITTGRIAIDLAASRVLGQGRVYIVERMDAPSSVRREPYVVVNEVRLSCDNGTHSLIKSTISGRDGSSPSVSEFDGESYSRAPLDSPMDHLQRFACR